MRTPFSANRHDPEPDADHHHEREGDQDLPPHIHQLVHPEARESPAEPHLHEYKCHPLRQEPEHTPEGPGKPLAEGTVPSAKEKRRRDGGDGEHVRVFRKEQEGEAHPSVFGVIPGHQLRLGFRDIERRPVDFGERGDEVDQRPQEQEREFLEQEPVPEPAGLEAVDLLEVEASRRP
jgi:hypothetical protein